MSKKHGNRQFYMSISAFALNNNSTIVSQCDIAYVEQFTELLIFSSLHFRHNLKHYFVYYCFTNNRKNPKMTPLRYLHSECALINFFT